MWKVLMIVAVLMVIPGTAHAGGGGGGSLCSGFAEGSGISMLDSCFNGTAHFAPAGVTLTVSNDGELPHTFTAVDGSFDSGTLQPGQTFDLTVDEARLVQVFCTLHGTAQGDGMAGVVVVGEPTPENVAAASSLVAFREAVAEDNGDIIDAIDRQTQEVAILSDNQTVLAALLEQQSETLLESPPNPASTELTLTAVVDSERNWVPVTSGIAAGMALAALLIASITASSRRSSLKATDDE
jgi:plastocyanin